MTELGDTLRLFDSTGLQRDWLVIGVCYGRDHLQYLQLAHIPEGQTAQSYGRVWTERDTGIREVCCIDGTASGRLN